VNTLPKREKRNITIKKFTHNTIEIDTPQGFLEVQHKQRTRTGSVEVRVMEQDDHRTLNAQKIGDKQKYIVGKYKIEVFCLPRRYFDVEIEQSATTQILLDAPGTLNLNGVTPVTGQIFEKMDDGSFEWVCNLKENTTSDRWELQPGDYKLVYRKMNLKSTTYTVVREFSIYSNKSISINL
jgi:Ca-activated chloride channel family protein